MNANNTNCIVSKFFGAADCRTEVSDIGFVGDGQWKGAHVFHTDRKGWTVVNYEDRSVSTHESLALVRLASGDADNGLNQSSLACDLEAGLWLVDADEIDELQDVYGSEIEIVATTEE